MRMLWRFREDIFDNAFGEFARDTLQALPGVKEIHSSFSLKALKSERLLPIPEPTRA